MKLTLTCFLDQQLSKILNCDNLVVFTLSDNEYISTPIKELIITYKIIDKDNTKISKITNPKIEKLITHKIKNYSLPTTMNLKLWGLQLSKIDNIVKLAKWRSKFIYEIELISPLIHNVRLLMNNETILSFKDVLINENDLRTFTRYINGDEYHYVNGKVELKLISKNTFNMKQVDLFKNKFNKKIIPLLNENFLTLDIETQLINNVIVPILIDIFDGINHYNFFIVDFKNVAEMINSALNQLLNPMYHNYKIYVHNLSNFDGIFLLKYLVNLKNISN
jgi:hypothetical protein